MPTTTAQQAQNSLPADSGEHTWKSSNRGRDEREKRKQAAVNLPEVQTTIEIIDVSEYRPKKIVGIRVCQSSEIFVFW
jgi:hypothetical protein